MRAVHAGGTRSLTLDHHDVAAFDSVGLAMAHVHGRDEPAPRSVTIARLDAGGRIGGHEATIWQVLVVLSGRVRVSGADAGSVELGAREAVQWAAGESHETVALTVAVLLIVEADGER